MEANELDIIFQKTFHQLSPEEKLEMKDLFENEDEFNQMKFMLNSLDQLKAEDHSEPGAHIKSDLDHLFHQTYQNKGVLWYNAIGTFFISNDKSWHQQNLVRIAAVLLVLLLFVPFWKTDLNETKPQLSKLEQKDKDVEVSTPNENITSEKEGKSEQEVPQAQKVAEDQQMLTFNTIHEERTTTVVNVPKSESDFSESTFTESKFLTEAADEAPAVSTHPDGVFIGRARSAKSSGFELKNHLDVLDLLTPTY